MLSYIAVSLILFIKMTTVGRTRTVGANGVIQNKACTIFRAVGSRRAGRAGQSFGRSVNLYQPESRLDPHITTCPPWIFKPSYGPDLQQHQKANRSTHFLASKVVKHRPMYNLNGKCKWQKTTAWSVISK